MPIKIYARKERSKRGTAGSNFTNLNGFANLKPDTLLRLPHPLHNFKRPSKFKMAL